MTYKSAILSENGTVEHAVEDKETRSTVTERNTPPNLTQSEPAAYHARIGEAQPPLRDRAGTTAAVIYASNYDHVSGPCSARCTAKNGAGGVDSFKGASRRMDKSRYYIGVLAEHEYQSIPGLVYYPLKINYLHTFLIYYDDSLYC
ncbi:hypothetical protein NDU88_008259 [Pleurodeles waltl]|uniref:Uncharacterized protein n=1 Tax=Pleurodeles waltl TaxID=8319 RepID=A0AAV7RTA2_PLEWA|nr:hypothetical protein NDU88_008259 [Pleurodeles waltl]